MFRVGLGFDVHRLVKGRKLILAGVHIPFSQGLLGNSDADVVLHAVSDALLGALGRGDIGDYFKDSVASSQRGFPSRRIIDKVLKFLKKEEAVIFNVDIVIILDKPRLLRHKARLLNSLSRILGIAKSRVNIKIKSQEGIWQAGPDNIMCLAVLLLGVKNENL